MNYIQKMNTRYFIVYNSKYKLKLMILRNPSKEIQVNNNLLEYTQDTFEEIVLDNELWLLQ